MQYIITHESAYKTALAWLDFKLDQEMSRLLKLPLVESPRPQFAKDHN